MKSKMKKVMMFALIASFGIAVLFAGGVKKAEALTLLIDDPAFGGIGVFEVIISDGVLAGGLTPTGLIATHSDLNANGIVSFNSDISGVFGVDWNVNIAAGLTTPPLAGPAEIDLGVSAANSIGAATLDIWLSDAGFILPGATGIVDSIGGTAGGNFSTFGGIGFANVEFTDDFITPLLAVGPGSFSGDTSVSFPAVVGPFSLTKHVHIEHFGAANTTFNNSLQVVPEPGTIALLGIGLAGLVGAGVRRRMKKS